MKKIPTIFERDPDNRSLVLDKINPKCQWVFDGEGVATRKYDGTCCMIKDGKFYKRRRVKDGKPKPEVYILEEYDSNTGKSVGWVPVDTASKEDLYHRVGFQNAMYQYGDLPDGTYELLGPTVQRNAENLVCNLIFNHKRAAKFDIKDRCFQNIKEFLLHKDIEGIVFHHPDGRMAKIKKRDFGFKR